MNLQSLLTSKVFALMGLLGMVGCSSSSNTYNEDDILSGTIAYPFVDRTDPLGTNGPKDKFVIRSAVGNAEYVIEIPDSAKDYDIEIPLADLAHAGATDQLASLPEGISPPQMTDREFVKDMPEVKSPDDRGLVEGAFGLGKRDGPEQSPSYTMRLAKINKFYVARNYEYALVEINNLLTFYPSSPKLYKMKGTILMKLRNYRLAEIAWSRGAELAPDDTVLKKALESLQKRIEIREKAAVAH